MPENDQSGIKNIIVVNVSRLNENLLNLLWEYFEFEASLLSNQDIDPDFIVDQQFKIEKQLEKIKNEK